METRQLEYFVAVAEELNFTRAATRLFAVQSTVSASIASLERDLETTLFDRSKKRISLTGAGEALLPEARSAIEAIDRVRSSVASSGGVRGRLRVGTFTSMPALDVPALLSDFHARHPLVDLQLSASSDGSTGFADDVRRGRLDLAFMGLTRADLVGFDVLDVDTSAFVAVLPVTHTLASAQAVALADLTGERFIDTPAGFGNRVVLDRWMAASALSRDVSMVVTNIGDIPRFVAAGLGIAVLPLATVVPADGTVVVPIGPQAFYWTLSVITRARPSPAAAALLDLMRNDRPRSLEKVAHRNRADSTRRSQSL